MYISADILEELLLKLPLKSLGKFKCVLKEWKSILESKSFVERHLTLPKPRKILTAHNCDCGVSPRLFPKSRFESAEEFVSLHCDATKPPMSYDGLLCIPETEHINVLNPSTGQLRRFNSPPLLNPSPNPIITNESWSTYFPGNCAMGFGRDSVKGSYKVVRIYVKPNYCDVLDVNTGEWRKLTKPHRFKVDLGRKSACVNGSIYWLRISRYGVGGSVFRILALDLYTEEFREVKGPLLPQGIMFEAQIVNIEDRLAIAMPELSIVHGWELEIWCMVCVGEETWSKSHSISLASPGITESRSSFTPLTISKQGNVVFYDDNKKRLFKYYKETDQLQCFSSDIVVISPYLENLVPLWSQQVELRNGRITCIRRPRDWIQSNADEFVCKGIDLSTWLWKNKIKVVAIYLVAYFLCSWFWTGNTVFNAAKLVFVCWLVGSGRVDSRLVKSIIMLKIWTIIDNLYLEEFR